MQIREYGAGRVVLSEIVLETKDLCKSFYDNVVLDHVNFSCERGEIHTLVGENGAGKSTLMKIISGVYQPTSGSYYINGEEKHFHDTLDALKGGVCIIHQEFNLVPYLPVYENLFLGQLQTKKNGMLDKEGMCKTVTELAEKMDIEINPEAKISDISIAKQQMVEIMRALKADAQIIIMDEPTATLTLKEVDILFKLTRQLRDAGKTIIYISHRLNEVFDISDRVTVLKDGVTQGTRNIGEITKEDIVNMMVGRVMGDIYPPRDGKKFDKTIMEVKDFQVKPRQEGFNFTVKEGEILGITGLEGQGQRELIRALYGLHPPIKGEVYLNGKKIDLSTSYNAMKHEIAFLTDDRKIEGLFLDLPIFGNICMPILKKIKKRGMVTADMERKASEEYMTGLHIKATSSDQEVKSLSGGNQQKVMLANCLSSKPKILIVDEPTRGIDVGAKLEIYKLLQKLSREDGITIIMVSSDLPEVINISDRMLVVYNGAINAEITDVENATENSVMMYATNVAKG